MNQLSYITNSKIGNSELKPIIQNKVVELNNLKPIKKISGIKSWGIEDRPREKLLKLGARNLTNSELLAILLGNGTIKISAVDLARNLLKISSNNLKLLSRLPLNDLQKINGIGQAKAAVIGAAIELGKRTSMSSVSLNQKIICSKDAYQFIGPMLEDLKHEEFWLILLDTPKSVINKIKLSEGTSKTVVIDKKKILGIVAAHQNTDTIILVHNHPSGHITPSTQDRNLTLKLTELLKLLDIAIVDHIIIGASKYFSFSDSGIL